MKPTISNRMRYLTLDEALDWRRNGQCSEEEYQTYAHAWQTSAARFATRACDCEECRANFTWPDYRPT